MTFEALMRETVRDVVREEFAAIRDELKAAFQPHDKREEYLSTNEAAAVLGVHPETVRLMVKSGRLPRREVAGNFRFARSDLDRLLGKAETIDVDKAVERIFGHGITSRNH